MQIECPSGAKVELRKMKLSDEDLLTNAGLAKKGENVDRLLENVTGLSTEEAEKLLIGDRTFILIQMRKISKGAEYSPTAHCPNCKAKFEHDINLDDLPVQKLNREKVDKDLRFEVVLPESKTKVIAKLLTGKEEKQLRNIRKYHADSLLSYLMMIRTHEAEGMKVKNIKWFKDVDAGDAEYFRKKFDEHDCGVETKVTVDCPECYSTFEAEVPFDTDFFLRTAQKGKTS